MATFCVDVCDVQNSTLEKLATICLSGMLLLTGAIQVAHWRYRGYLRYISLLAPVWNLFAPHPYQEDLALAVSYGEDGQARSEWREVPVFVAHKWYRCLWNPGQYREQGAMRLMQILLARFDGRLPSSMRMPEYLALGCFAMAAVPPSLQVRSVRLAIIRVSFRVANRLVFVSPPTELGAFV
jgi:hypothetical protein